MNKLRIGLGVLLIGAYIGMGFCDLYLKKWDTSALSFLFAMANVLIFFGH